MDKKHAQLSIPPCRTYLSAASDFIAMTGKEVGLSAASNEVLFKSCRFLLNELMLNSERGTFSDYIKIDIHNNTDELKVEILNKNLPLPTDFGQYARTLDLPNVHIENLGPGGQKLIFNMRLEKSYLSEKEPAPMVTPDTKINIRPLKDGEEAKLTELFFNVYGYNYIHQYVYYPEQIKERRKNGDLICIVGVDDHHNLLGHVALVRLNTNPVVYEAALGVVDPRIKSRGLFTQIFESTMEHSKSLTMSYCIFDFVTNHDFTQKLVSRYGSVDMALLIGCQSKENQASLARLGLGQDPDEMDRYSLLLSLSPRQAHPFGQMISLPTHIGENFSTVLQSLGLTWQPSPRFDHLGRDGEFLAHRQPSQKAIIFDLYKPGRAALQRMVNVWQQLVREGYQYAGVNVPISAPGLAYVYDFLSTKGFFIGGLIPYRNSHELGFRFQALGPTRVGFDQIKVYTHTSQQLLRAVKDDFLRNTLI
ncbi:MAG: hypothetical protein JNL11_13810 [Bdellovibrionaceae bacterium]|nr:hypothetical protein [Pseudobdellovibrionaceae bacterium]